MEIFVGTLVVTLFIIENLTLNHKLRYYIIKAQNRDKGDKGIANGADIYLPLFRAMLS
jgi:hypothetical protein